MMSVPKIELVTTACLVMGALALGPSAHAARAVPAKLATSVEPLRSAADEQRVRDEAAALSKRWAPIFVQQTDAGHPERDRPLRIDFDGDWDATNDWVHLDAAAERQPVVAYGSAILSETHAFLTYTLFYPRDWEPYLCVPYACHDNDLEVVLLVVDRSRAERPDGLVLVETKTHHSYLSTRGAEVARADALRPVLSVESQGHGLESVRRGARDDGELRVFVPAGASAASFAEADVPHENYALLSLHDTLWARRQPRAAAGRLWTSGETGWLYYQGARAGRRGSALGASMANSQYPGGVRPPWALRAAGERGDWFLDPAFATLERHARWFERGASFDYALNPYLDDLTRECSFERCLPAPPAPASVGLSPVALGAFMGLGVAGRLRRRRALDPER